jgi:hypothetical protein
MRLLAVALLALPLAAAQEDAKVRDLIQKLEDDSFDVREQAQKDLTRMGEAAIPALRAAVAAAAKSTDRGELKARAEAVLREIDLAAKSKAVYREPARITLRLKDAPLAEALKEIGRQAGVRIDASGVDEKAPVTVEAEGAPLFRVLDDLCRGRDDRTYEYREEGTVKFAPERHVSYPADYPGAFRVRVVRMRLERTTDFKDRKATLHLSVESDHEKYLKPSKSRDVEISKAVDDKGGALEVRKGEEDDEMNQGFGGAVMRVQIARAFRVMGAGAGTEPSGTAFTLRGLSEGASKVTLQGNARFSFPLDARTITFERPQGGETQDVGDYTVKLDRMAGRGRIGVTFSKKGAKPQDEGLMEEVEQRIDAESIVGIDEDGAEHKGTLAATGDSLGARIRIVNGVVEQSGAGASYQASFPSIRNKALKEFRFRFVSSSFIKSVPFRIEGIALP